MEEGQVIKVGTKFYPYFLKPLIDRLYEIMPNASYKLVHVTIDKLLLGEQMILTDLPPPEPHTVSFEIKWRISRPKKQS